MLHNELTQYLSSLEAVVRAIENAQIERYEEEILAFDRVNVRLRVRFENGKLLEINEAVIIEAGQIRHLGYRYHFQDQANRIIFRYDDTPHFPGLFSFPHHKHTATEVQAVQKPSILEAIKEAVAWN